MVGTAWSDLRWGGQEPGEAWFAEQRRTQKGFGRNRELFFCIRSSQDPIQEIEHFYCIFLVTWRPLCHPRGCWGKVESTSIHVRRRTQEGSKHLILSSHRQRIWVSRRRNYAPKLAVIIQYYSHLTHNAILPSPSPTRQRLLSSTLSTQGN